MLKFFIVMIVFFLALSLFLAMSIGVAFILVWIFPAISFEIGVLIVVVSQTMIFYLLINIFTDAFPKIYLPPIDDDHIDDKNFDEYDVDHIKPRRSTRSNRRKRR
jgi:hypothetical protein